MTLIFQISIKKNKYITFALHLFIFLKFHTLIDILKNIDYTFGYKEKYENVIEVVKMTIYVFLSSHIMAIIYHVVGYIDIKIYNNENIKFQLNNY